MSGLCGWFRSERVAEPAKTIDMMARELSRYDVSVAASALGSEWAVAHAGNASGSSVFPGDGGFAIVHGRPEISDREISASAGRSGLPESLAMAYRRSGPAFLECLSGPFSLAVALFPERRLLLAIDRGGIESLYYAPTPGGLVFASTLPGLAVFPDVTGEIELQSVFQYLYFHVIPSPDSIYRGVRRLQPGQYVELADGVIDTAEYWKVRFSNETSAPDFDRLKREFRGILKADVEAMVDDNAQVGCFLSGGTDSSTVAGLLTEAADGPAKTYSIGFAERGYDEMEYAHIASRHFRTEHHEYYVTPDDVVDLVPRIASIYGEPFGNSSAVPAYYCAAMAAGDGIELMLAGDGGDELFGGNERYGKQTLFSVYERLPSSLRRFLLEPLLFGLPLGERVYPVRKARRYVEQAKMCVPARMESYNLVSLLGASEILEPDFLAAVDRDRPLADLSRVYESAHARTMLNRMQASDMKYTLADNDLPKVKRMCEMGGVEVAFPLLSDSLVEFSSRLPASQKVRYFKLRYFFKRALEDFLPREIINKPKHGFGLPIGRWLISDRRLRELGLDSLNEFKRRGIIRANFIDELIGKKLEEHPDYYGTLVWLIMILEHWFAGQHRDA